MIDFEVTVDGRVSEQHPLVKIGCASAFLTFVLLTNYVPVALAVWLIILAPENRPLPPLWAWLFAGGLLAGMVAIGWYCIMGLANWFTDGRLNARQLHAVVAAISLTSAALASVATVLGHWQDLFLGAVIGVFVSGISAILLTAIGQTLDRRRGVS